MYLDQPLRRHMLFQAITRTNRRWTAPETGQEKTPGASSTTSGSAPRSRRRCGPSGESVPGRSRRTTCRRSRRGFAARSRSRESPYSRRPSSSSSTPIMDSPVRNARLPLARQDLPVSPARDDIRRAALAAARLASPDRDRLRRGQRQVPAAPARGRPRPRPGRVAAPGPAGRRSDADLPRVRIRRGALLTGASRSRTSSSTTPTQSSTSKRSKPDQSGRQSLRA